MLAEWPTFQGVATVVAGIAGFVVLAGAVGTSIAKLWQFRIVKVLAYPLTFPFAAVLDAVNVRRVATYQTRLVTGLTTDAARAEIVQVVATVIEGQVERLMQPNGGNSVADVSTKVDKVAAQVAELDAQLSAHLAESRDHGQRLDRRLDEIAELVTRPT